MPNWTQELIEVKKKHINTTHYAVADKSPHPPPSYFTWSHLYKREEKIYIHILFCARKLLESGLNISILRGQTQQRRQKSVCFGCLRTTMQISMFTLFLEKQLQTS